MSKDSSSERNGCSPCRSMKKICDEEIPECNNCRLEGLICSSLQAPTPGQTAVSSSLISEIRLDDKLAESGILAPTQVNVNEDKKINADPDIIWLSELIRVCNCDSIPKILLYRALSPSGQWGENGEPSFSNRSLYTLYPYSTFNFPDMTAQSNNWLQHYTSNPDERNKAHFVQLPIVSTQFAMSRRLLDVLIVLILALPEPQLEIAWEAIEDELWEVLESTCLPLLGVITLEEFKEHLSEQKCPQQEKGPYLFIQIKRLIHLTIRLGLKTPPNVFSLISHSIELLERKLFMIDEDDIKYLQFLNDIGDIIRSRASPYEKGVSLQSLDHAGSKRSNAAIGFALASLPPSWMVSAGQSGNSTLSEWKPLYTDDVSTMEVLAQAELMGAWSLTKISGIKWKSLHLDIKVQIGFSEAKKRNFSDAAEILEQTLNEIDWEYGSKSLELLLVGTVIINCWNRMGREEEGLNLGRHIGANIFDDFKVTSNVETTHQVYLMIAMADSFLGENKYDEAKKILANVLDYQHINDNISMCATLRLLKINRRLKNRASLFDDWSRLEKAVKRFDGLSDTLKYESIEETLCCLATLENQDISSLPQVARVVKVLSRYHVDKFHGSSTSALNTSQNLKELERFGTKLNLFSLTIPELNYYPKTRDQPKVGHEVYNTYIHSFTRSPPNMSLSPERAVSTPKLSAQPSSSPEMPETTVFRRRSDVAYQQGFGLSSSNLLAHTAPLDNIIEGKAAEEIVVPIAIGPPKDTNSVSIQGKLEVMVVGFSELSLQPNFKIQFTTGKMRSDPTRIEKFERRIYISILGGRTSFLKCTILISDGMKESIFGEAQIPIHVLGMSQINTIVFDLEESGRARGSVTAVVRFSLGGPGGIMIDFLNIPTSALPPPVHSTSLSRTGNEPGNLGDQKFAVG